MAKIKLYSLTSARTALMLVKISVLTPGTRRVTAASKINFVLVKGSRVPTTLNFCNRSIGFAPMRIIVEARGRGH